jgi:trans-aconitate methyltransferase
MEWNSVLYDKRHHFVSNYGEDVISLLALHPGEKVLDLGCGTGDLTHRLTEEGAEAAGLDASADMIRMAQEKYPDVPFFCADATGFTLPGDFDAVFSNAALHWITDQDRMLDRVYAHLRPAGRFVAEFGAKDNVAQIIGAIRSVLQERGFSEGAARQPWYFPSVGEYATRLEAHGFEVAWIASFVRPTPLADSERGIIDWLEMFGGPFFHGMDAAQKEGVLAEIQERLYPVLYLKGQWIADYKRLRFYAKKTNVA